MCNILHINLLHYSFEVKISLSVVRFHFLHTFRTFALRLPDSRKKLIVWYLRSEISRFLQLEVELFKYRPKCENRAVFEP